MIKETLLQEPNFNNLNVIYRLSTAFSWTVQNGKAISSQSKWVLNCKQESLQKGLAREGKRRIRLGRKCFVFCWWCRNPYCISSRSILLSWSGVRFKQAAEYFLPSLDGVDFKRRENWPWQKWKEIIFMSTVCRGGQALVGNGWVG